MNLYRVRTPDTLFDRPAVAREKWDRFRDRLAMLQSSPGSQAVLAQRRAAKIAPPLYVDPLKKEKRRQRNRARRARQGQLV